MTNENYNKVFNVMSGLFTNSPTARDDAWQVAGELSTSELEEILEEMLYELFREYPIVAWEGLIQHCCAQFQLDENSPLKIQASVLVAQIFPILATSPEAAATIEDLFPAISRDNLIVEKSEKSLVYSMIRRVILKTFPKQIDRLIGIAQ